MQEAVPEGLGAMAAVLGLEDAQVQEVCKEAAGEQIVSAANYNSAGQVVIAGHKQAVERALTLAKEAGAKRVILIPISVPSHCELMREAADRLAPRLEQLSFSEAQIPIIQNVDAQVRRSSSEIKQALIQQLHQPVRWVESINSLKRVSETNIIEIGPGKVLSGLIRRIDTIFDIKNIDKIADIEKIKNEL